MTHAGVSPLSKLASRSAPVAGDGCFVPVASYDRFSTPGNAAGSSTATTVWLPCGSSRCNSAPSDTSAQSEHRTPSADTADSARNALGLSTPVGFLGIPPSLDFFDYLKDLGWGSWERSLPDSSSLGGDSHSSPRRFSFSPFAGPLPDSSQTLPKLNSHQQRHPRVPPSLGSNWRGFLRHPLMAPWLPVACQNGLLFRRHR